MLARAAATLAEEATEQLLLRIVRVAARHLLPHVDEHDRRQRLLHDAHERTLGGRQRTRARRDRGGSAARGPVGAVEARAHAQAEHEPDQNEDEGAQDIAPRARIGEWVLHGVRLLRLKTPRVSRARGHQWVYGQMGSASRLSTGARGLS